MWKKLAALPAPALALLFLLGLLRSPAAALEGARRGLAVCAGSIVPFSLPWSLMKLVRQSRAHRSAVSSCAVPWRPSSWGWGRPR